MQEILRSSLCAEEYITVCRHRPSVAARCRRKMQWRSWTICFASMIVQALHSSPGPCAGWCRERPRLVLQFDIAFRRSLAVTPKLPFLFVIARKDVCHHARASHPATWSRQSGLVCITIKLISFLPPGRRGVTPETGWPVQCGWTTRTD